jgi:hypothetical protein
VPAPFDTLAFRLWALSVLLLSFKMLALGGFTVGRVAHTLFYLNGRMPNRTVAYALGYFAMLWMVFASAAHLLFA